MEGQSINRGNASQESSSQGIISPSSSGSTPVIRIDTSGAKHVYIHHNYHPQEQRVRPDRKKQAGRAARQPGESKNKQADQQQGGPKPTTTHPPRPRPHKAPEPLAFLEELLIACLCLPWPIVPRDTSTEPIQRTAGRKTKMTAGTTEPSPPTSAQSASTSSSQPRVTHIHYTDQRNQHQQYHIRDINNNHCNQALNADPSMLHELASLPSRQQHVTANKSGQPEKPGMLPNPQKPKKIEPNKKNKGKSVATKDYDDSVVDVAGPSERAAATTTMKAAGSTAPASGSGDDSATQGEDDQTSGSNGTNNNVSVAKSGLSEADTSSVTNSSATDSPLPIISNRNNDVLVHLLSEWRTHATHTSDDGSDSDDDPFTEPGSIARATPNPRGW
ncbi:hypothetical protein PG994_012446 [Apiospora phragmitis]|uniref:Uncharacterized protein n=1 Tax=Apiospora phragmitis TaxID=2905665 RepID=A0ABR1TVN6_9PEZI